MLVNKVEHFPVNEITEANMTLINTSHDPVRTQLSIHNISSSIKKQETI